ncbi:MAG: hydrogenase maturation protein [Myxococcales bacterium]|nr:hydrogenase maturation protein [Myxococcales bacterium]
MLAQSFNSLTQRLFVELRARGHEVSVELDVNDAVALEAVELAEPDLVLAPFLRRAISAPVWRRQPCLVVHPGPPGDGGASALDRAILEGAREWGVTVLEAEAALDAGPVWASRSFALRDASKGSLYRREVTEAAVEAVLEAVARFPAGRGERPAALRFRPPLRQAERAIDWSRDDTATVLRKIRSADGQPGVLDALAGEAVYLYDATPGVGCPGAAPGALVGRSSEAVCRATADGAVWLGTLRRRDARPSVKLPALAVLGATGLRLPELPGPDAVRYEQANGVGYLSFAFCNGAMSTAQCRRLTDAVAAARACATRVLVLLGGPDFWSNGIHLGVIEAAPSPADESWRNIVAMDDLCRELVTTTSHVVVAALQGNAAAGGVFLALAADRVVARAGVVLNPHYRGMGNLYGSEYWTYLLPRRVGAERARVVTEARLPMGVAEALDLGLVDACLGRTPEELRRAVRRLAEDLVASPELDRLLADKRARRAADEADKPLERYRQEELARMHRSFYGFDSAYHVARHAFVCKVPKARTPRYLATHRQRRAAQ